MGMVQKQGNWAAYEIKRRDVEHRSEGKRRKWFLHQIMSGDEKWIHTRQPEAKNGSTPTSRCQPSHASTLTVKPNIYGKKLMLWI
ncbi:hypothetical protein RB195_020735 [Necator americanus]|uniref:Uncharacterized protein n=1 Tax=Necator americanus TaxID=51031 RepID=A0ABR1CK93_NECAM